MARADDCSLDLDRYAAFKRTGFVALDNAIADDPRVGIGDHDGMEVLLQADPTLQAAGVPR
jgi:hypothetical protein